MHFVGPRRKMSAVAGRNKSEARKQAVVRTRSYTGGHSGARGLQQEGSSATTAATTGAARSNGVAVRDPEQHSSGTIGYAILANHQCHRRFHRRHWRSTGQRIAVGESNGFGHVSLDRERNGRKSGGYGANHRDSGATAATTADGCRAHRRRLVQPERQGCLLRL